MTMDRSQSTDKRPSLPPIASLDLGQRVNTVFDTRPPPRLAPKSLVPPLDFDSDQEVYLDGLPLKEYKIGGKIYTMQRPENEEHSVFQRKTVDDRTLQYDLNIIQQPAKARACGAGPRSAADRRPVDPPPVVELRVFEISEQEEKKEITMSYDASFLLHASLEASRPIANGQRFNGPLNPVLTGVPVAGANYLDRPKPAAYFIFSDLSVRHEGWFRLRFQLFEKVKLPGDADPGSPLPTEQDANKRATEPKTAMTNRMEVVSAPFQVYSAKKFPGLSESTQLSRVVAEQGCRVRIRRDVRQRKRTATKDDADCMEDDHASCGDASMPQTPVDRGHSVSRSDFGGSQADHYRRQSMDTSRAALQPRPKMESPAVSASVGYLPPRVAPNAAAAALIDMSQGGHTQPTMPPPSALPAPPMAAHSARPSYALVPDSRAVPQVIIPDICNQRPERASQPIVYDAVTRHYNMPEPSARKRSISPRTEELQERQRPRLEMSSSPFSRRSIPSMPSMMMPSIAAATHDGGMDAAEDDDSSDSGLLSFSYKRADGTRQYKPVEQMRKIYATATPSGCS